MLGLNCSDATAREVVALGRFARDCGIAFQLKDDILGIVSDEGTLGKPIGSDIREGKKTVILQEAYANASADERRVMERTVGNRNALTEDIEEVKRIFRDRKGLEKAEELAASYINDAMKSLDVLPDSEYKTLLGLAADFMSARKL